jgi:hypothetical protein
MEPERKKKKKKKVKTRRKKKKKEFFQISILSLRTKISASIDLPLHPK